MPPVEGTPNAQATETQAPASTEQTAAAPTPQQDPQLASRFGALAKRERSILNQKREFEQMRAQFEADRKAFEAERARHIGLYESGRKDPRGLLSELGWDYNKLTEAQLKNFEPNAVDEIKAVRQEMQQELQALKDQQRQQREEETRKALESERQQYAAQVQQAKDSVAAEIRSKGDEFEFINTMGEHELVYVTMQEHFAKTGKIMEVLEAAKLVEEYIEQEEVAKVTGTKKFQSRFQTKVADGEKPTEGFQQSRTLTNMNTSGPQGVLPAATENERMQRALAALNKTK